MDCGDSDLEEIDGTASREIVAMDETVGAICSKRKEESTRQCKGKGIVGPSRAAESSGDGESISPRTHRVNLGLTFYKMDLVEGWVEYVGELSGGHEDPEAESEDWAYSEYSSKLNIPDFTKLRDQYRILKSVRLIHPNKTDRHLLSNGRLYSYYEQCPSLWDEIAFPPFQ
ncbi:hypothetical protein Fot_24799 [Forsythia ovata]|uniref:Uncharacterized protein n=1 Tax=Forsythia ovata TaxID=205694 RepID=A0ABD1U7U5_9LAMI